MKRKLPFFAVVFLAASLLFTACPIQFDPDGIFYFPNGTPIPTVNPGFSGTTTGYGLGYQPLSVVMTWVSGVFTGIAIGGTFNESVGHFERQLPAWLSHVNEFGTIPPRYFNSAADDPLIYGGLPRPPDILSSGTFMVNGLREAALDAIAVAESQ